VVFCDTWVRLAPQATTLITNCVQLDDWKPVTKNKWFSSSVVDLFRVLYEILDLWDKIDW
jgi:hypothetical protein